MLVDGQRGEGWSLEPSVCPDSSASGLCDPGLGEGCGHLTSQITRFHFCKVGRLLPKISPIYFDMSSAHWSQKCCQMKFSVNGCFSQRVFLWLWMKCPQLVVVPVETNRLL